MAELERLWKNISESVLAAANAAQEFGKLIADLVQEDSGNYEIIKRKFDLTDTAMEKFQKVGLGRMSPQLVLDSSVAAKFIEQLPRKEQDKILTEGITVVRAVKPDGKPVVEKVPHKELSSADVDLVFSRNKMRSINEQAEKIKKKLVIMPAPAREERYTINLNNGTITFNVKTFSLADLKTIVDRELEKVKSESIKGLESKMRKQQIATA